MSELTFKNQKGDWVTYQNPEEQIQWLESEVQRLEKELTEARTKLKNNGGLGDVVGQSEQLANFCKKISKQKDCPAEFQDIVNKEFWNLIG